MKFFYPGRECPYVFSFARERSTSYVVSQSSLGRGRHSRHSLATRLARRAYRRRFDPYPAGHCDYCLVVQPLCRNAQRGLGEVSHSSRVRVCLFVREQESIKQCRGVENPSRQLPFQKFPNEPRAICHHSESSRPLLQIGQRDRHLQFASQPLEMLDEWGILLDRLGLPAQAGLFEVWGGDGCAGLRPERWRFPDVIFNTISVRSKGGVPDIPHFGEKRDVRTYSPSASTKLLAFCQVGGLIITTGSHLEKRDCDLHCEKSPFFSVRKRDRREMRGSSFRNNDACKREGRCAGRKGAEGLREKKAEQPGKKQNGKKQTIPGKR